MTNCNKCLWRGLCAEMEPTSCQDFSPLEEETPSWKEMNIARGVYTMTERLRNGE